MLLINYFLEQIKIAERSRFAMKPDENAIVEKKKRKR